mgnify:CR=1 FL=1
MAGFFATCVFMALLLVGGRAIFDEKDWKGKGR